MKAEKRNAMFRRFLPIGAALALVTAPGVASAKAHPGATSPITLTFTYSLVVTADCTLTQNPGGNFAFAAIDSLSGNATTEFTTENVVTATCSATTANLVFTDGCASCSGTTNFHLVSGAHTIVFQINNTGTVGGTDYMNGGNNTVNLTGTATPFPLYGVLPPQTVNPAGTYNDTVTATLTFS
jgi:spore coat protein U-like protein